MQIITRPMPVGRHLEAAMTTADTGSDHGYYKVIIGIFNP
jgi:hypothetical protein